MLSRSSGTLVWAARRYLMARYDELQTRYSLLPGGGREGYHYTTEAKQIFPRYNVVEAILTEVERLDPESLPAVETVAEWLFVAAEAAQSPFTELPNDEIETEAIALERRLFAVNVRRWLAQPDLRVDPLPYRRVLAPGESTFWRAELQNRWGVRGGLWHPLMESPVPQDVLVLAEHAMWADDGVAAVRRALRDRGRGRVVEVREYGADYLLDAEIFAPRYTGAEGLWTDADQDWIAYASHEGTVAFGGVLAAGLVTAWPGIGEWRWPGWPGP
ncbi:hypothetical protein GCM10010435_47530 [Winogradskya consettensis]|uniref:Uncharacterized protein n=1 Tax=Winogradskya consettensis TaxID=113560 RepID=A0A919SJ37_9ACTN|nr:hypothetical protein [Actinoplanes consettensis]GIM72890.1 hypothetical protein Aco04nite_32460 [Actinoplanes consettensis]